MLDFSIFELIFLAVMSFIAGGLTLFTGFGLSTILLPVFVIFFPAPMAIATTAIVHFINNFYKLFIFVKEINVQILYRFGIPGLIASIFGALSLNILTEDTRSLKIILGIIIIFIALLEMIPRVKNLQIDMRWAPLGGLISGFFGGLSGHQGLFRSMFLVKSGLQTQNFIATGVGIAVLIDLARLTIYGSTMFNLDALNSSNNIWFPVLISITSALLGVSIASDWVTKITIDLIQKLVYGFIFISGVLLILGII